MLAVALGALLVAPAASAAAPAFGVNAQFLLPNQPPSAWPNHLDAMQRDGIAVVRSDANWAVAEPAAPVSGQRRFNWGPFDVTVAELAKRGLQWLPIVDFSAPWAASQPPSPHAPPSNPDLYAGYAAALAARYGPGGAFWAAHPEIPPVPVAALEVWNEPDTAAFWPPAPNPAAYADLYLATRDAVHTAAGSVEVLVGGLTQDPPGFLRAMVAARPQLRERLDGVAIHPYAASPTDVMARVITTRATLNDLGLGDVPLDVTEVGWPIAGSSRYLPTIDDRTRADAFTQLVDRFADSGCGIERVLPHTWVSGERNRGSAEDWYGIVHPNGSPTLTATAYAAAIAHVREHRPSTSPLPRCPDRASSTPAVGAGAWLGLAS